MRKISLLVLLVSLAAMVACGGSVCDHHHHDGENSDSHDHGSDNEIVIEPKKAEKLGIETIKTRKLPFSGVIKVSGKIGTEAASSWNIIANCSGKVSFLRGNLDRGSEVKKAEILFAVNSKGMNTQNSAAELEKSKAIMEHAKREYERAMRLREERLVAEGELLLAKREYQTAETEYKKMISAVNTRLASPANGFITYIAIQNGQYVEEGATIATVSTGKDIVVEAMLPARYSSKIGKIAGANFTCGSTGEIYSAQNLATSSDIAQGNGTFIPIRFKAQKAEGITVGIPAEVYVKFSDGNEVIFLPKDAISERYGKYFVYEKLDEDCYTEREVTLGDCDGINVEIKSGIEEGDEIVSKGVYYVRMAGSGTSIPHGHSH